MTWACSGVALAHLTVYSAFYNYEVWARTSYGKVPGGKAAVITTPLAAALCFRKCLALLNCGDGLPV